MKDHSQHGEGKIIADAVAKIEYSGFKVPRIAVEFGAGNGEDLSNTRGLVELGWRVIHYDRDPSGQAVNKFQVTAENVNHLEVYACDPIGVISIDVDGNDYWIWKAMTFNPAIVCIEFNPTLTGRKTIKYDADHRWTEKDNYCGASFQTILDLGHRKGYNAIFKTLCNVIFVRADLWPDPEPKLTHEPIYVWPESEKEWQEV